MRCFLKAAFRGRFVFRVARSAGESAMSCDGYRHDQRYPLAKQADKENGPPRGQRVRAVSFHLH